MRPAGSPGSEPRRRRGSRSPRPDPVSHLVLEGTADLSTDSVPITMCSARTAVAGPGIPLWPGRCGAGRPPEQGGTAAAGQGQAPRGWSFGAQSAAWQPGRPAHCWWPCPLATSPLWSPATPTRPWETRWRPDSGGAKGAGPASRPGPLSRTDAEVFAAQGGGRCQTLPKK